jgi:chromosome segregation ATPase
MTTGTEPNTDAMTAGRRADTQRRRDRVLKSLNMAITNSHEISVSTIARQAGVDRTFLYRHHDLLEQIHAAQAQPTQTTGPAVSRASLQADLLASHERAIRLSTKIQHLEQRLSESLGEQTWRESGLGAPTDIDQLNQQIVGLEQQIIDLQLQLQERSQDLEAARSANRELMTQLNAGNGNR